MNKFLIIFLAVCLITVHAHVKRDAPAATTENYVDTIKKKFDDIAGTIKDNVGKAFDPDTIKKNFDELVDKVNNAISSAKSKEPAGQ